MLVLTRKVNESIRIGSDIQVQVVRIEGDRIRLGITAPKSISILRDDCKNMSPNPDRNNS